MELNLFNSIIWKSKINYDKKYELIEIIKDNYEIGYLQLVKDDLLPLPELEYLLDENYWNQKIMSEELLKYLSYLKGTGITRFVALVKEDNEYSIRLLNKYFVKTKKFGDTLCYMTDLTILPILLNQNN